MQHADDYLMVEGDYWCCGSQITESKLTAGTVEIKGDFTEEESTFKTAYPYKDARFLMVSKGLVFRC